MVQEPVFSAKLLELEREYERLQQGIRSIQGKDEDQLREELDRILEECRKYGWSLEENRTSCRSPAAAELAGIHLEYFKRMEELIRKELPREMRGRNRTPAWDQAEASLLYAEYVMDFATQAMHQALAAAIFATLRQLQAEGLDEEEQLDEKEQGGSE